MGGAEVVGPRMAPDVSLQSIVVATDDQLYAEIEAETVILHSDTRTYYSFNPVAGRIWELLQEPRPVEEIKDTILQEYDVSPDRCEADLLEFLAVLSDEGLVEFRKP